MLRHILFNGCYIVLTHILICWQNDKPLDLISAVKMGRAFWPGPNFIRKARHETQPSTNLSSPGLAPPWSRVRLGLTLQPNSPARHGPKRSPRAQPNLKPHFQTKMGFFTHFHFIFQLNPFPLKIF